MPVKPFIALRTVGYIFCGILWGRGGHGCNAEVSPFLLPACPIISISNIRSSWVPTEEANISPEDRLLKLCAHQPVAVTLVCVCDLSLTKAAGERSGVFVQECV